MNIGIRHTNFSTVAVDEIPVFSRNKETAEEKQSRLFELLATFDEPTLVYCSAPERAANIASNFAKSLGETNTVNQPNNDIIEWVGENINDRWSLIKCLSKGVGFHNGTLPRHLGSSIVDAFNGDSIKILFCTATLIEGVNTEYSDECLPPFRSKVYHLFRAKVYQCLHT